MKELEKWGTYSPRAHSPGEKINKHQVDRITSAEIQRPKCCAAKRMKGTVFTVQAIPEGSWSNPHNNS
jgi:hypothetical protein